MKRKTIFITACLILSRLIACTNQNPVDFAPLAVATPLMSHFNTPRPDSVSNVQGSILARPQMGVGRAAHTATLLPDGTVLLAGGFTDSEEALSNTEIFDPATYTFSSIQPMSVTRQSHTATLLQNGKVLLAGGFNGTYLASAELYDLETGLFTPTGSMTMPRSGHKAILLDDGKVLLVGGTGEGWRFLATAEIYDPHTGGVRQRVR